jgi:hypothetical protein
VTWNKLQVKLKHMLCVRLKRELRETEYEMEVHYCEPE